MNAALLQLEHKFPRLGPDLFRFLKQREYSQQFLQFADFRFASSSLNELCDDQRKDQNCVVSN